MPTDLDNLTIPQSRDPGAEIFGPLNAWPGASSRIYVQVNPIVGGVYQIGYDPNVGRYWIRLLRYSGGGWSAWKSVTGNAADPPVPISAALSSDKLGITVEFSLSLDPASVPAPDTWTIICNTQQRPTVGVVMVGAAGVYLSVAETMPFSAAIDVSYLAPTLNPLRSQDGIAVASFLHFIVQ